LTEPLVIVRAVHFATTLLAAGTVYFVVLVLPRAAESGTARLRLWLAGSAWTGLALCIASEALWLVLNASAMSGRTLAELWPQGVIGTVLWQTVFGNAWLLRGVAAVLLAGTLIALFPKQGRPSLWAEAAAATFATILVGSLAWAGHAIGASGFESVLHPFADVLHLISAAAWLGTLPLLALLLSLAARGGLPLGFARRATVRFSVLGMASVAVLLTSGLVNTWYLAGSIAALTKTLYGRLLLIKIALFLGMITIAAANRLYLMPRLMRDNTATAATSLRRNAVIETLAGVVVLIIVARLGTLPPGNHVDLHNKSGAVPANAAYVHIHGTEGMADVTILPGRAGRARATIRLADEDFNPLKAKAVTLSLAPPATKSATLTRAAISDPDDNWDVGGIELPRPGNWTVTVDVTLGGGKHLLLDAPIVIEPAQ
jgi:putative copper resistance protein D